MKKLQLLIFILLICYINISAQTFSSEISTGILYSDVKTIYETVKEGTTWRRGFWVSTGLNYKPKKWLNIEGRLTYQERIPLEVLTFSSGNIEVSGVTGKFILSKYPTSPQHKLFHTANYLRIPNFKYFNIEIVPMVSYGETWSVSIGVGFFGGILLNRNQTTITKEDLPHVAAFFEPPGDAFGKVSYYQYDVGWIPKIKIQYKISPKVKIGLHLKSYQSFTRLNDTFVYSDSAFNMRWMAFAGGLGFEYHFYKAKK